jgi:hypothetical protein
LVDVTVLQDPYEHHFDSFGTWSTPSTAAHYYDVNVDNFEAIRVDMLRNRVPDRYAFKCQVRCARSRARKRTCVQVHRFRHMSDARFRKYIYTLCDPEGMPHRALIYYTWLVEPRELAPTLLLTGAPLSAQAHKQHQQTIAYYRELVPLRIGADGKVAATRKNELVLAGITLDESMPREFSGAAVGNALQQGPPASGAATTSVADTTDQMLHDDDRLLDHSESEVVDDANDSGNEDRPISVEDDHADHTSGAQVEKTAVGGRRPDIPRLLYDTNPTPTYDQAAARLWFATDDQLNKLWARIHIDFSLSHATFLVDLNALIVPKLCHRLVLRF